jgi:hypothetical protein
MLEKLPQHNGKPVLLQKYPQTVIQTKGENIA